MRTGSHGSADGGGWGWTPGPTAGHGAVTGRCGGGWAARPSGARMTTVIVIVATVGVGLGQGSRTAPPARPATFGDPRLPKSPCRSGSRASQQAGIIPGRRAVGKVRRIWKGSGSPTIQSPLAI
jgi:hypothetical protein